MARRYARIKRKVKQSTGHGANRVIEEVEQVALVMERAPGLSRIRVCPPRVRPYKKAPGMCNTLRTKKHTLGRFRGVVKDR